MRVLVVDDHEIAREAVCWALAERHGHDVVGAVANATDAMGVVRGLDLDVVLVDANLGRVRGVDLVESLLEVRPDLPVVLMSVMGMPAEQVRASGARGFVEKDRLAVVDIATLVQ